MADLLYSIDVALFRAVNVGIANTGFDAFFLSVTEARFWIVPGLLGAYVVLRRDWRRGLRLILLCLVAILVSDLLAERILKPLVGRSRPCHPEVLIAGARCLLGRMETFSFPSTHAMTAAMLATLLSLSLPAGRFWFITLGAAVALSRIYCGAHYPSDVAVGCLVGIGAGGLIFRWWGHSPFSAAENGECPPSRGTAR